MPGNANAKSTIAALDWLERHFMAPTELLTDGGKTLENLAIRRWLAARGTILTVTTPYVHNGVAESAVKLVTDRLRKLSGQDLQSLVLTTSYSASWVENLQKAVSAVNDRKLEWMGGYSPRQVLFGRSTMAPTARHRQSAEDRDILDAEVQKAFDAEQMRRVEANEPRTIKEWHVGQLVLVRDASKDGTHDAGAKLAPKYTGPYRIRQVLRGSVTVNTVDGQLKKKKFGFDLLKEWHDVNE